VKTVYAKDGDRGAKWQTYRAYSQRLNGVAVHGIAGFYPSGTWTRTEHTFRGRTHEEAQRKAERFWHKAQFGGFVEVRLEPLPRVSGEGDE
jgi:hypothetical protein